MNNVEARARKHSRLWLLAETAGTVDTSVLASHHIPGASSATRALGRGVGQKCPQLSDPQKRVVGSERQGSEWSRQAASNGAFGFTGITSA
jgi:hypothetical protein